MFLQFILLHLLILIYPGPGFFALISRSTYTNRIQSSLYSFGMALADASCCVVGLLFLSALQSNIIVFKILKILGGCYLIYIGAMMIIKAAKYEKKISNQQIRHKNKISRDFISGFFMAISNPKAAIFYSNLLIQFISLKDSLITKSCYILWIFLGGGAFLSLLPELFRIAVVKELLIKNILFVERILGSIVILFAFQIMFF
jgi:threonine/homoserine/homoserine lactone efflux protein